MEGDVIERKLFATAVGLGVRYYIYGEAGAEGEMRMIQTINKIRIVHPSNINAKITYPA